MVAWAAVEFMTSRDIGQEKYSVKPLKLRKVDIQLFQEHFFPEQPTQNWLQGGRAATATVQ